jgi:uncharacterized protein (TIGR02186 family)
VKKASATLALVLLLSTGSVFAADDLVADMSSASIAVTTGFSGTTLTVFGALDKPAHAAEDIVVSVTGPDVPVSVRRKVQNYGLWVNGDAVAFPHAPGFYALASTRPLRDLATADSLAAHGLGLDALESAAPPEQSEFRAALIRLKQAKNLYSSEGGRIRVTQGRLFRADFDLPANVPMGAYRVHIAVVRQGAFIIERDLPLSIDQRGIAAVLHDAVYGYPFLYAFASLALIFAIGAVSALATRKGD